MSRPGAMTVSGSATCRNGILPPASLSRARPERLSRSSTAARRCWKKAISSPPTPASTTPCWISSASSAPAANFAVLTCYRLSIAYSRRGFRPTTRTSQDQRDMRAIVVRKFGHHHDVARLETLPKPEPAPGHVVVRNKAAGVSFAASLNIAGKYQRKAPLPYIPAPECAGIVEAVGEGVTRVTVGDHVMCSVDNGGAAGFCHIPEVSCFRIPKEMDFGVGTAIITSYNTSYGALTRRAELKAGETLLVHGAAGAVGMAAVEIGKALGATVIAVAGGEKHCASAKRHGADHVIDHRKQNFRDVVMEITGGKGVNVVYDSIGGDVTIQSIRSLAWEGRLLTIGYASGTIP